MGLAPGQGLGKDLDGIVDPVLLDGKLNKVRRALLPFSFPCLSLPHRTLAWRGRAEPSFVPPAARPVPPAVPPARAPASAGHGAISISTGAISISTP